MSPCSLAGEGKSQVITYPCHGDLRSAVSARSRDLCRTLGNLFSATCLSQFGNRLPGLERSDHVSRNTRLDPHGVDVEQRVQNRRDQVLIAVRL